MSLSIVSAKGESLNKVPFNTKAWYAGYLAVSTLKGFKYHNNNNNPTHIKMLNLTPRLGFYSKVKIYFH